MKKVLCLILAAFMCASLCSCALFSSDTEELIAPPQLSGDMSPIKSAIEKSAPKGYSLKYPSAGNRRSAVILEDINGDGLKEAFAFYSTDGDELTKMHINMIAYDNDAWKSVCTAEVTAGGVEKVEFCDIDGDGIKEIAVGWEIFGSGEKKLAVYKITQKKLVSQLEQPYTSFICCDLNGDSKQDIFVHLLSSADQSNSAMLFAAKDNSVAKIGACLMDKSAKSVLEPKLSVLSTGQAAVYIDEIKGIGAVTEIIFWQKGELKNGLLDSAGSGENTMTVRQSSILADDVNDDGIIEIPVAGPLKNADPESKEIMYYTNWCTYNGEALTVKACSVVNTVDGYIVVLPDKLMGKIAVKKDSDLRLREIYSYEPESDTVGEKLFELLTLKSEKYDKKEYKGYSVLTKNGGYTYLYKKSAAADSLGLTDSQIRQMFKLYGQ